MNPRLLRIAMSIGCGASAAIVFGTIGAGFAYLTGYHPLAGVIACGVVGFVFGVAGSLVILK